MSTNQFGGRIVNGNALDSEIIAFGESQLLGLDVSDKEKVAKHDLSILFPSSLLTIYAAPNNGPLQAIQQMREIHRANPIANKKIVTGFNYGTDIFRIDPGWQPNKFVPLNMSQLERSFRIPGYHDVILFIARLRGVKFGSTVSNAGEVRQFYQSIDKNKKNRNIEEWLNRLRESEIKYGKERTFVLYPPYWYIGANELVKADIQRDYISFACKVYHSGIFDSVFVAALPNKDTKFASDNRHFLSGQIKFEKYACKNSG